MNGIAEQISHPCLPQVEADPLLRQETVSCVRAQISTLKSNKALPAARSETGDARSAPACSSSRQCPLRFSARRTGVQGRSPAALFPRFLSRERNRAAGGIPH